MDPLVAWEFFRWSILSTLLAGLIVPQVGVELMLRRTSFYGVVLPEVAATGVAAGYAILPLWIRYVGLGGMTLDEAMQDPHSLTNFLLVFACIATGIGLLVLGSFARAVGTETGRLAVLFVVAGAATILLAEASPLGAERIESLVRGEVLAVDVHDFETLAVALALAFAIVARFRQPILLAGFDPDASSVMGLPPTRYTTLLLVATGLVVAAGTLIVGPLVLFALLVLPPIGARQAARSMRSLRLSASLLGVVGAALGLLASFEFDVPLGPCLALVAGAMIVPAWGFNRVRAT